MFYIALLILAFTASIAKTEQKLLRVAVIDTGLDLNDPRFQASLCSAGHKDFTGKGIADNNGHGTHIAGIVSTIAMNYGPNPGFCLLIYKYYTDDATASQNIRREVLAIKEAIKNGANIVNFSSGGPEFHGDEYYLIKNHPEVTFVVAAGNDGKELNKDGYYYYPASYFLKNEIVVSNSERDGTLAKTSNFGSLVNASEIGQSVISTTPGGYYHSMSGTSQATAKRTGKLIREILNAR